MKAPKMRVSVPIPFQMAQTENSKHYNEEDCSII